MDLFTSWAQASESVHGRAAEEAAGAENLLEGGARVGQGALHAILMYF